MLLYIAEKPSTMILVKKAYERSNKPCGDIIRCPCRPCLRTDGTQRIQPMEFEMEGPEASDGA